jgi:hypothetical protein
LKVNSILAARPGSHLARSVWEEINATQLGPQNFGATKKLLIFPSAKQFAHCHRPAIANNGSPG